VRFSVPRVSKHWTPPTRNAKLRPSRIRREPVKLNGFDPPKERKLQVNTLERQLWGGVTGIVLITVALVLLAVGISIATFSRADASAQGPRFGQCYNNFGSNCVLTGDTLYLDGDKVQVANLEVPAITNAKCPEERDRGINAALRFAELLNGGTVTASVPYRDFYGRKVRKVFVNGDDVAGKMIADDVGRRFDGADQGWCASAN
jgi:micrococcal nuclease